MYFPKPRRRLVKRRWALSIEFVSYAGAQSVIKNCGAKNVNYHYRITLVSSHLTLVPHHLHHAMRHLQVSPSISLSLFHSRLKTYLSINPSHYGHCHLPDWFHGLCDHFHTLLACWFYRFSMLACRFFVFPFLASNLIFDLCVRISWLHQLSNITLNLRIFPFSFYTCTLKYNLINFVISITSLLSSVQNVTECR